MNEADPSSDVWDYDWWEENPGPGRPENNWVQRLPDNLRVFQATEGSPSLFGVETALC